MATKNQEKMAILKDVADFPILGKHPVLSYHLELAANTIAEGESLKFLKNLVKEQREKCQHNGAAILISACSITEGGRFNKICPLCGETLQENIKLESL
jgi:hypothetical protein